jgi:hypothetical protein
MPKHVIRVIVRQNPLRIVVCRRVDETTTRKNEKTRFWRSFGDFEHPKVAHNISDTQKAHHYAKFLESSYVKICYELWSVDELAK